MYLKNVDAVIFVFDVCWEGSFWDLGAWREDLEELGDGVVIAVVGNKIDLNPGYLFSQKELAEIDKLRHQQSKNIVK